ncbi:MAG: DUF4878 domain-containing protein [Firmicutes bacterium]|nr:DUF4878 domain-containing protein [Bacillota bacterium]
MATSNQPRDKQKMLFITTGAVTLVLALIVVYAALTPQPPEMVVSGMLDSLAQQDYGAAEKYVAGPAREQLQAAAESVSNSRWNLFWDEGAELFAQYRIGEVQVTGDEAEVLVYYGPGLIQEEIFHLRKVDGRWKVTDYVMDK